MYSGLSLDQAPPISVVMRFFLSVPVFGLLLSAVLFLYPDTVLIPYHPVSLGAIHLMFLGIVTMSMIGALFQMQSVLGGRPIPAPLGNSLLIHTFLVIGILTLVSAFVFQIAVLYTVASVFLGSAIIHTAVLLLPLLFTEISNDTLRGMRLSVISLSLTAVLGIVMASAYANGTFSFSHDAIRASHYSLGLIGWIGALIIAVAFQVIEMFYVTTSYNPTLKRNVFRLIALSLLLKIIFLFAALPYGWGLDLVFAVLFAGFVLATLRRLHERKRRVSDVSIWFWNAGMGLLGFALIAHLAALATQAITLESIALIGFALFALAVILGMMSKIVPFLVWFHLNSAGYMETPIMSHVIPANRNKALFFLFCATSLALLGSLLVPGLLSFAAAGLFALFVLLGYNLYQALALYRHICATGTRFDFSGFPEPS